MGRKRWPGKSIRKGQRHTAILLLVALQLGGCGERAPEGQVLVVVEDTEITIGELQEALKDPLSTGGSQNDALEALVVRKILSQEAERRNLQNSGEFHFALREAREQLLVSALQRDLDDELTIDFGEAVERELVLRPWRYGDRFVATLARVGSEGDVVTIDSGSLKRSPPTSLLEASSGVELDLEGDRWRVLNKRAVQASVQEQRAYALQQLRQQEIDARLERLIQSYRQNGRIRYQKGWGAAAEGAP